jgi:hypothetical protein
VKEELGSLPVLPHLEEHKSRNSRSPLSSCSKFVMPTEESREFKRAFKGGVEPKHERGSYDAFLLASNNSPSLYHTIKIDDINEISGEGRYAYAVMHIHSFIYIYMFIYICIHIYVYMYLYIYTCMYIYTHTYTYIHLYMYTYIYTNIYKGQKDRLDICADEYYGGGDYEEEGFNLLDDSNDNDDINDDNMKNRANYDDNDTYDNDDEDDVDKTNYDRYEEYKNKANYDEYDSVDDDIDDDINDGIHLNISDYLNQSNEQPIVTNGNDGGNVHHDDYIYVHNDKDISRDYSEFDYPGIYMYLYIYL